MPLELVTVPRVPVCRTGHFDLESGPIDFTVDHFTAAVEALANDPAVLPGRVRIELEDQGHLDVEGLAAEAGGGMGGPSIGWMDGYTVAGNTLYADLHVPAILADSMEWAFPGRSIEGLFGYTTATGHTHDFLPTGLLLLGTSWPGVTTLPDFAEVQAEFGAAVASGEITTASYAAAALGAAGPLAELERARPVAAIGASGRPPRPTREQMAAASLAVTDLGMRWYAAERDGELDGLPDDYDFWSWYVTEIRADDDGTLFVLTIDEATGRFWRFDATISGSDVTFAEPVEVMLEVVPVGARARLRPALARWGSRTDSRASASALTSGNPTEDEPMTDALRRALAARHGLDPETATDAEVEAAELAAETNPPEPTPETPPETPPEGDPAPEGEPTPTPEPEPAGATARTRTVSAGTLEQLQADAAEGRAARARQVHGDRDRLVLAALADGRITPAESGLGDRDPATGLHVIADGWRRDLEDAPEVTARALARLQAGKYPGAQARRSASPQGADRPGSLDRALAASGVNRKRGEG